MMVTPIRLLMLVVVALSAGLASLWLDQQGSVRNITWVVPVAKAPDITAPVNPLLGTGTTPAASYTSIFERPLFAIERRQPPPPPPPAPPPPPDPFLGIQIYGIVSGGDGGILARIEGRVRRVKINEAIGGWTLKSIQGRQINFVQGAQTRQFQMTYSKLN